LGIKPFKKPFDFVFRLELVLPELMANGEVLANGSTAAEIGNVSSDVLKSGTGLGSQLGSFQ
jgi:hypothetical protein